MPLTVGTAAAMWNWAGERLTAVQEQGGHSNLPMPAKGSPLLGDTWTSSFDLELRRGSFIPPPWHWCGVLTRVAQIYQPVTTVTALGDGPCLLWEQTKTTSPLNKSVPCCHFSL